MQVTGATHVGRVRSSNRDALQYGPLGDAVQYAVVCDGMGGANGGNVASEIAAEVIARRITEHVRQEQVLHSPEHLFSSAMEAANLAIYERALESPDLSGMGTTVVAAVMRSDVAYISHVGDSRLYLFRQGRLTSVTRDHSVVQEMIESGQLTEEQARSHPRKHFITRALGVSAQESGEYDELPLEPGDRLLLCTDGLTNMVENRAIAAIMAADPPAVAVPRLIQAALDGGGRDNVTVVIMDLA